MPSVITFEISPGDGKEAIVVDFNYRFKGLDFFHLKLSIIWEKVYKRDGALLTFLRVLSFKWSLEACDLFGWD